jgi:DNA-binding GntR family transcriptional regulator
MLPKRDQTYHAIKHQIVLGALPPGATVVEQDLAERLGVSLTPVRQALDRLADDGFLVVFPRKGRIVKSISPTEFEHLLTARAYVEGPCAGELAKGGDRPAWKRLVQNVEQLKRFDFDQPLSRQALIENDLEFHQIVAEGSRNPFLVKVAVQFHERCIGSIFASADLVAIHDKLLGDHMDVLNAIMSGKRDAAMAAIMIHVKSRPIR